MIKIENLVKIYKTKGKRKTKALKGISLTLPDTGMVFVIGKSGSGKSTLLNMIGGLDDITSGDIIVNGNSLSKFSLRDFSNYRSTHIGFIFQDYHILEEFTVKENIELSADIRNVDCDVKKCLEFVSLDGFENRYPNELSGGQQQRVAIARALAKDSKVILADEPTGNLDASTTKQILDLLKELSKERLVLIVSHNLDDAYKYADRIISLDNGLLSSDVSRIDGYKNELVIEDKVLYLPHHTDLDKEQVKFIIDEKSNYDKIVQNNNGMVTTEEIDYVEEKVELEKSTLSNTKFKKLFNLIFKRRVLNKLLTIFLASVIISLFYIFQAFNSFDENAQLVNYYVDNNQDVVLRKNDYNGTALSRNAIVEIGENDVDAFIHAGYKGEIYKLYNNTVYIGSFQIHSGGSFSGLDEKSTTIYLNESLGTLNCTLDYLMKLYGVDGKLDYIGNLYEKDYGVIITDYIADDILIHCPEKFNSYEDILGTFQYEKYHHTYINAIVKTGYKEKYKSIFDKYSCLFDDDPFNDNIINDILEDPNFSNLALDINRFLGISYNLSPNYEEASVDVDSCNYSYNSYNTVICDEFTKTERIYRIYHDYLNLKGNEAYMTPVLYNSLFGTNYTVDDVIEKKTIKITTTMYTDEELTQEITVIGLVEGSNKYLFLSKEKFIEYNENRVMPFALYFNGIEGINKIIPLIEENGYYVTNVDGSAITYVERLISIFGKFLNIIAISMLLACVVYLMHFGYKSIISNYYEIGIISALGCNNKDIGKLFLLEILTVGIGIMVISLIGMFVGAYLSNLVLINSFEIVFKISFSNIDVITFVWDYVLIDLVIGLFIVVISALFPMFYIRRVKPVNILKAKE